MIEMLQKEMPELETGMYVKFKKESPYSERFGMVVWDRIIILYPTIETLWKGFHKKDISEVYEVIWSNGRVVDTEIIEQLVNEIDLGWSISCIWKEPSQKEVKELTMKDLEEHFKCKVKIVKG